MSLDRYACTKQIQNFYILHLSVFIGSISLKVYYDYLKISEELSNVRVDECVSTISFQYIIIVVIIIIIIVVVIVIIVNV